MAYSKTGTTTDEPLYSDITTYFDVAFANLGTTNAAAFNTCLYVDSTKLTCWRSSLATNTYTYSADFAATVSTAGWHTVTLKVDADNEIAETNESDNTFTVRYLWESSSKPNLHPAPYTNWPAAVVPASHTGTNQKDALRAGVPTYIDWSVVNDGWAAVRRSTSSQRCMSMGSCFSPGPGIPVEVWLLSLCAGSGLHFQRRLAYLELRAHTTNVIKETNETDNAVAIKFYWDGQSAQPDIRVAPAQVDIRIGAGGLQAQAAAALLMQPDPAAEVIDLSEYQGESLQITQFPRLPRKLPWPPSSLVTWPFASTCITQPCRSGARATPTLVWHGQPAITRSRCRRALTRVGPWP